MSSDPTPAPRSLCGYPWQQLQIDLTGEVVPCCFLTGYGNTGKPLGNTNEQTLDQIWNGPAYQELRRRNASGDLAGHPCNDCMAYRWTDEAQPGFEFPAALRAEAGHAFLWRLPPTITQREGDLVVLEDGRPLPRPNATVDEVRAHGQGRWALWGNHLAFSSSDGSDVITSGRRYRVERGDAAVDLPRFDDDSTAAKNLRAAYAEYRAARAQVVHQPTMITLVSTADCNIDCPSCSQNHQRPVGMQHRAETVPAVLAKVPYLHQFTWQGGEPFLIRRFREFIADFRREDNPHLVFGFTSNGTMITANEVEKLKKFPRLNASISIDSFVPETFEKVRAGARFETVLANTQRLFELHDSQRRVFAVGMTICKENFAELAVNLRRAIDRDIGLNLSPMIVCPVTGQINVFESFEGQTVGWAVALSEARKVVTEAHAQGRLAMKRVAPDNMIAELERHFRDAQRRYSTTITLRVRVRDIGGVVPGYPRPGIVVVSPRSAIPSAYRETPAGGDYVVDVPACDLVPGDLLTFSFMYDLANTQAVNVSVGVVVPARPRAMRLVELTVRPARVDDLPKNVTLARYGADTPSGLTYVRAEQLGEAYERLLEASLQPLPLATRVKERVRGSLPFRRFIVPLQNRLAVAIDDAIARAEDAERRADE